MTVSGAQLQDYFAALAYPVSRKDLVRWGQENGLSTEMLQALRLLPEGSFNSPAELSEALKLR